MKKVFKQFNKTAIISVCIAILSIVVGLGVNIALAAIWQDPTASPPNLGSLEPPLNISVSVQEKTGGLYIATDDGYAIVGGVAGSTRLTVHGISQFNGSVAVDNINVSGDTDIESINTVNATINNNLNVDDGLFKVDTVSGSVLIATPTNRGMLTVVAENEPGIDVENDSVVNYAIWGINTTPGGTGVFGNGRDFGVSAISISEYGVLADASSSGVGGLYARGGDRRYGVVGRGLYGIVGLDNTENETSPVFSGSGGTLAGLFEGSVDIIQSTGGDASLTVDNNTFVVNSSTDKIGIGTDNPATTLHIKGINDQVVIYAPTETNTMHSGIVNPNPSSKIVAGVYGEGGTITYSDGGEPDIGWSFGVFGEAGHPGTGRSVGIGGLEDVSSTPDTFAGRFYGDTMMNGPVTMGRIKSYLSGGSLTVSDDITADIDLNLAGGTESDINLTGTASDINLSGNIDANGTGDIEYMGKLEMTGGLPVLQASTFSCNVEPANYAEGTMFECVFCVSEFGQRYFITYARMNREWVNIGYTKGTLCGGLWEPEIPSDHDDDNW